MSATRTSNRTAGDDRAAEAAASVARRWVFWYCGLVGTEAAERRRAEIESDLWEQRTDARKRGAQSLTVAASIAWRVVGGVPDDLLWVRTQRLAMRGQRADRKATPVNYPADSIARWWWVAGAAVLAALYLGFGIDNLVGDYAPLPEAAAQCFAYLALLLAGIACSVKAPRTCTALVAAGSLPILVAWWSPPLMIFGAAIAIGALVQIARMSAPGFLARAGGVLGGLLLGCAAIAPMLVTLPGLSDGSLVPAVLTIGCAGAAVVLLVLTRSRASHRAETAEEPALRA